MSKHEPKHRAYQPDPATPADSHNVLDMLTATAKALGWQQQGASTSTHWVTITVTDGADLHGDGPPKITFEQDPNLQ